VIHAVFHEFFFSPVAVQMSASFPSKVVILDQESILRQAYAWSYLR